MRTVAVLAVLVGMGVVGASGPAVGDEPEAAVSALAGQAPVAGSTWIHAEPDSGAVLARGGDGFIGVWVDVPAWARARVRAPVDLALVIDVSGSMEGAKIQAARASARTIVERLADGDILSVDVFSDTARPLVAPVRLTPETRAGVLSRIAELGTGGSTNMFDGLAMAERHAAQAPADHPVRRIVMISDGQANVGPSSPEALGELAERSLGFGAQVTSLGVGLDYDERTLDAIAMRTSGRLFHIGDPREMQATLEREVGLLSQTVADQAFIEVVPAPGVTLSSVDGAHFAWTEGRAARIPLGTLFAGQHREALVRVRVSPSAAGTQRALASVRLAFHDPAANEVERVQEVLARVTATNDDGVVAQQASPRTHAMMATLDAAKTELQAAQDVGSGNYAQAEKQLAQTEQSLRDEAARTKDDGARQKLDLAAQSIAHARATAAAAPAAAPADVRGGALEMNKAAMGAMGY